MTGWRGLPLLKVSRPACSRSSHSRRIGSTVVEVGMVLLSSFRKDEPMRCPSQCHWTSIYGAIAKPQLSKRFSLRADQLDRGGEGRGKQARDGGLRLRHWSFLS